MNHSTSDTLSTNLSKQETGISQEFLEQSVQQLARILGEPTHNYKDRIFRMLVNDKKVALEIYNAMNGTQYSDPDKLTTTNKMRLSDAYEHKSDDIALELTIEVININYGHNQSLLEKCPTLQQYAIYIDTVRKYQASEPFAVAVEHAIDECIAKNVLADFLRKNRAEVLRMSLFYYDEEKHIQQERDESYQEGVQKGIQEGIKTGIEKGNFLKLIQLTVKKLQKNKSVAEIADALEEDETVIQNICDAAKDFTPDYDAEKIYNRLF